MYYTIDSQVKLQQIQKLTAIIKQADKVRDQLLSDHCPTSGLCSALDYIQKTVTELNCGNNIVAQSGNVATSQFVCRSCGK